MEKKSNLLDLMYQELLWMIVGAVRNQARTIPAFRDSHNGCIRITIIPLSRDADEWLGGGLDDYRGFRLSGKVLDACAREFVFKIHPKGSYTIQYVCEEDGHTEPVNCYGYSALKTAWAFWKKKFDETVRKKGTGEPLSDSQFRQQTQFFTEDNGWSMHDGAVYTTVTLDEKDFCCLYVCTSGAKASEDKECSLAGILAAQRCFRYSCSKTVKCNPCIIDDKKSPLEQVWRD